MLSGPDADLRLGGLLGDFWRGAPDRSWRPGVRAGVLLHRRLDVFTDSHPQVAALRAQFEPPWRRYAGILIDVYFDHALARAWAEQAADSLAGLSCECSDVLAANADWLPASLNRFAAYLRAHGLFVAYAQPEFIEQVLAGIGTRLRRANPLAAAGPALWQRRASLDAAFAVFFPQALEFARRERARLIAATD